MIYLIPIAFVAGAFTGAFALAVVLLGKARTWL